MKVRQSRYIWPGRGHENSEKKPIFDVNNNAHRKHFNRIYRQEYFRPTGIIIRDPGTEWNEAELTRLWELFAIYYQELLENARVTRKELKLPLQVPEAEKEEMAKEVEKVAGHERSSNSVATMAHRSRRITKDFVLTFDTSSEILRQAVSYNQLREDKVDHVIQAVQREGQSLSEDIRTALEHISGTFMPFEWDIYMSVDAEAPRRQLPSTGLPLISLAELQLEVESALRDILGKRLDVLAWERATQVAGYFYRSNMCASEMTAVQPLLARMGLSTLNLQALIEEEGLAIFNGLSRKEGRSQRRDQERQLDDLVATARQTLNASPANMPSGGQIDQEDVRSFGVVREGGGYGWLTDQAITAGLQT